ncbi:hypothetical protein AVEN_109131-1 [Araneus ventricosus]|uniref:Uncharacterized protein n=1 Tax=Araneus ventricosus TaxID=182803 RepID=A0A4Y2LGX6_ARAVE|nr:hypothetical protein AVEN_109131-1 [Araneus ventricosus]
MFILLRKDKARLLQWVLEKISELEPSLQHVLSKSRHGYHGGGVCHSLVMQGFEIWRLTSFNTQESKVNLFGFRGEIDPLREEHSSIEEASWH